ncbi:MAG: cytochrome C [Proteobacteria bacterium]|nr:cytochrome C [Pseudomonadota bacterium]
MLILLVATVLSVAWPSISLALPMFARQTGQNCMACHAGGQFPELTQYGRLFKLTGYTMGQRTIPLSAMAVVSDSKIMNTNKSQNPREDFQKNGSLIFATASAFIGGKITDNLGAFIQVTYDNYAAENPSGSFSGHTNADNMDIRYADRHIDANNDLIWGLSANNNPSVSDVWNTAAAWMQYVPVPSPTSSRFIDGSAPYPSFAAGGNIAGLTAYAFWNQTVYAEFGGYRTAKGIASFMSAGVARADKTALEGVNPYWRIAINHSWGPHNIMVGASGMRADVFDDPLDTSAKTTVHHYRDFGVDAQYQYLLDPHSVTLQAAYMTDHQRVPDFLANQPVQDNNGNQLPNTNARNTVHVLRLKGDYVYRARYGGSLSFFNQTGTTDSALYDPTPTTGNISGNPAIRGWTVEAFWLPVQYLRVGLQYTMYGKFNGASHNYDGNGRNASDNNTLFFYLWGAY